MTTIGFIRHGVTNWNKQGRAQGVHDVPLNEEGMLQAGRLAQRMAKESWDYIYSSDLSRAAVTADIIARGMGKQVNSYDKRLREKTHGRLDGTTEAERISQWGEGWKQLDHGEETPEDILQRSLSFLKEKLTEHAGKRLLVVSHGAWLRTTFNNLLPNRNIESLDNTSLSILRHHQDGRWECQLLNCRSHLELS